MFRYLDRSKTAKKLLAISAALALIAALLTVFAGSALAATALGEKDYFGTITSVVDGAIVIETDLGPVEIPTSGDTEIKIRHKSDATIADLVEGDFVGVSLEENGSVLVADKIHVIPGKTLFRHVPGEVIALSDTQITIQPQATGAEPVIFTYDSTTTVHIHDDDGELALGSFVIIVAARDTDTGELLPDAREINVVKLKPSGDGNQPIDITAGNWAEIKGVFNGVDAEGNWLVGDTIIVLGPDTKIEDSVTAGQFVEVTALLQKDGSLLAIEIEPEEKSGWVAGKTKIEGIFEGVDEQGNWIVSGSIIAVDDSTDTDGLPYVGQRVKAKAILQDDGSLLAREIENKEGKKSKDKEDESNKVELEGTFQGIADNGNWIINGTEVVVNEFTELKGVPAVGSRIKVKALFQQNGSLVAAKVKGEKGDDHQSETKVEIKGAVEQINDGTITVDGIEIAMGALTEIDGDIQVGNWVKVEAIILDNGSLMAREVEVEGNEKPEDTDSSEVEIKGTIEVVNIDGTFVVSGVPVVTNNLTKMKGELVEGATVKIEGVLQSDGSILAHEMKGDGRRATSSGTEFELNGLIETVQTDTEGNIISIVVEGITIQLEDLTEVEGRLKSDIQVKVKGIIDNGSHLASEVEAKGDEDGEDHEVIGMKIEGFVENIHTSGQGNAIGITVNGLKIVINPMTSVEGTLEIGVLVKVKATPGEGAIVAKKIQIEDEQ